MDAERDRGRRSPSSASGLGRLRRHVDGSPRSRPPRVGDGSRRGRREDRRRPPRRAPVDDDRRGRDVGTDLRAPERCGPHARRASRSSRRRRALLWRRDASGDRCRPRYGDGRSEYDDPESDRDLGRRRRERARRAHDEDRARRFRLRRPGDPPSHRRDRASHDAGEVDRRDRSRRSPSERLRLDRARVAFDDEEARPRHDRRDDGRLDGDGEEPDPRLRSALDRARSGPQSDPSRVAMVAPTGGEHSQRLDGRRGSSRPLRRDQRSERCDGDARFFGRLARSIRPPLPRPLDLRHPSGCGL